MLIKRVPIIDSGTTNNYSTSQDSNSSDTDQFSLIVDFNDRGIFSQRMHSSSQAARLALKKARFSFS